MNINNIILNNSQEDLKKYFFNAEHTVFEYKKYLELFNNLKSFINPEFLINLENSTITKDFLLSLFEFLNKSNLSKAEKLLLLNGSELILTKLSLEFELLDLAVFFNSFRSDRSIEPYKYILCSYAKSRDFKSIFNILNISSNLHFDGDYLIKLFYMLGVRDIDFYTTLVDQYGFNINSIGNLPESNSKGSFSHLVYGSYDSSNFFQLFNMRFGNVIDFSIKFRSKSGLDLSFSNLIVSNNKIEAEVKNFRILSILESNLLFKLDSNIIFEFLLSPVSLAAFNNKDLLLNLFQSKFFNSSVEPKYSFYTESIKISFSDTYIKERVNNPNTSNYIINTLSILNNISSQLHAPNFNSLIMFWLDYSKGKKYNIELLSFLVNCASGFSSEDINLKDYPKDVLQTLNISEKKRGGVKFIVDSLTSNFASNLRQPNKIEIPTNKFKNKYDCLLDSVYLNQVNESSITSLLSSINEHLNHFNLLKSDNGISLVLSSKIDEIPSKVDRILKDFITNRNSGLSNDKIDSFKNCQSNLSLIESDLFDIIDKIVQFS